MSQTLAVLLVFFSLNANANEIPTAYDIKEAKTRCLTHFSQSDEIYANDFKWGYTLLEMEDRFAEIYDSGKRLNLHSRYNSETRSFQIFYNEKKMLPVNLTPNFIKSVTRQIEVAIANGFADFVFFPDMGHSHLYFPEEHWQLEYGEFDTSHSNHPKLYEKMLADPKMKALYHLAEQLQMQDKNHVVLEDEMIFFKYWHRNFVGLNDGSTNYQIKIAPDTKKFNTVRSLSGHKSWSAGFAVSASKDGCFPYLDKDGKKRYFDIGLQDPRYDPSQSTGDENGY